ncbi:MAG: type II CAAX endopeptidase family protein [Terriglobia bacterium]
MRSLSGRIMAVAWSGILGFLIIVFGAGVWAALVASNLKTSPAVPWAVPVMALVLGLMWLYLGGKYWPRSTSQARRRLLRANPVSAQAFGWALLAGVMSIAAFAGYWIVMFQLVKMPGNALPDFSRYPLLTVALMILMGSLAAPLTEEPAFRGYCQVILEREFRGPIAVVISSVLFALAHGPTQGFLLPKLLFYFLVGVAFGATAYLTDSILPAIPVHVAGLLIFFSLVWPHDANRRLLWEGGGGAWFWIHAAQTIIFTALAILAFLRLARVTERMRTVGGDCVVSDPTSEPVG